MPLGGPISSISVSTAEIREIRLCKHLAAIGAVGQQSSSNQQCKGDAYAQNVNAADTPASGSFAVPPEPRRARINEVDLHYLYGEYHRSVKNDGQPRASPAEDVGKSEQTTDNEKAVGRLPHWLARVGQLD